ncbi:MAG: P-loop NTPase fold protein [Eubacteriales bacterium]
MKLTNHQIVEIVEGYIKESRYTQAILIDGAWGSGKTYFLKNHFKEQLQGGFDGNIDDKYLYISLYGVSSTESIQKLIFQSFRDDYMKRLADSFPEKLKFLKPIPTNNKKVNFDFQSIAYKSIASFANNWLLEKGIDSAEFDLADYIIPQNIVIIFDDLERCQIDIHEVLGYINNLVEHNGVKAIIVANEEQISGNYNFASSEEHPEKEDDQPSLSSAKNITYKRIKEKLIGLTIKYEPCLEDIYDKLIESVITDAMIREKLGEHKNAIIDVFIQQGHQNIRTLLFFFVAYEKLSKVFKNTSDEFMAGKEKVTLDVTLYLAKASIQNAIGNDFKEWSDKEGEIRFHNLPCETLLQAMENDRNKTLQYRFVDTLVIQGYLDVNKSQAILESLYVENHQIILVEEQLAPWFRGDDTSNEKILNELRKGLSDDLYTANQCFRILSLVLVMELFVVKGFEYGSLINLLCDKATNKLKALGPVKSMEILHFATFCTTEHEVAREKYLNLCNGIREELQNAQLDVVTEMNLVVKNNETSWGETLLEICSQRGQEFQRENSFLKLLDRVTLLETLKLSSQGNIISFAHVLKYAYNNIYMEESLDHLNELCEEVNQLSHYESDGYKKFGFAVLLLTLNYQIEKWKKENQHNIQPDQA